MVILILVLNFGISWWNAYACGKAWAEAKAAGGFPRFMCWMGAIMSAVGFTWVYVACLGFGAYALDVLTIKQVGVLFELGYVVLAPAVLFSGAMIMVDSWANAFRNGGVLNYGVAVWNTYAQVHNTLSVIDNYGSALGDVFSAFGGGGKSGGGGSSDDDGVGLLVIAVLFVVAVAGGILTTTLIIRKTSASDRLPSLDELQERKRLKEGR
jgi:hypothetical protein